MSRPITWQTINAPSLGDPNRSMQGVVQSIGDAFTPLREQLRAYQSNEARNWEVGKDSNTEAFMAQLTSRYKTPQELAAAQASGELDQLRSSFGAQIDQARTREALDTRGSVLQKRDLDRRTYDNLVIEDTIRPQMQEALSYVQKNDTTGLNNFLADPKNATLKAMKQGDLMAALKKVEFENEDQRFQRDANTRAGETLVDQKLTSAASRANMLVSQRQADDRIALDRQQVANAAAAQRASAANQAAGLQLQRDEATVRGQERAEARLQTLNQTLGRATMTIGSKDGTESVLLAIKDMSKNNNDLTRLRSAFGDLAAEFPQAHPAAVIQALSGSVSTSGDGVKDYFRNSTGDSAKARLQDIMRSPQYAAERAREAQGVGELAKQANFLRQTLGYPTTEVNAPRRPPVPAPVVTAPGSPNIGAPRPTVQVAPRDASADLQMRVTQLYERLALDDRIKEGGLAGIAGRAIREGTAPLGIGGRRELERQLKEAMAAQNKSR